jgi:hypothetical protein
MTLHHLTVRVEDEREGVPEVVAHGPYTLLKAHGCNTHGTAVLLVAEQERNPPNPSIPKEVQDLAQDICLVSDAMDALCHMMGPERTMELATLWLTSCGMDLLAKRLEAKANAKTN